MVNPMCAPGADHPGFAGEPVTPAWPDPSIPKLVARVYEGACANERGQLLEQLLRPLSLLSLAAIADGVFAKIRIRYGWQDLNLSAEDIENVRGFHVLALADFAQQVSVEAVDGLAQIVTASSGISGSAAAVLLVALLVSRSRSRRLNAVERRRSHLGALLLPP
jgi:hypothetical protein